MYYRSQWLSYRRLRVIADAASALLGRRISARSLCDRAEGRVLSGGFAANVEEKLLRSGMSFQTARSLLREILAQQ